VETYVDRHKLEIFDLPGFLDPFRRLVSICLGPGDVPAELKQEVFTVAAQASGCRHCQAHGAYGLHIMGASLERIQALWNFETSDLFAAKDRTALRFARDAGLSPNLVTAAHYRELRQHYSDRQIKELLAVIAISGFLNRYSDTLAVVTDAESADWAREALTPVGWEPGKHSGAREEQRPGYPRTPEAKS
jgi:hypothetical protein